VTHLVPRLAQFTNQPLLLVNSKRQCLQLLTCNFEVACNGTPLFARNMESMLAVGLGLRL
jgi:hypothetical protein